MLEVFEVNNNSILNWIQLGNISIPNILLSSYSSFGISEEELVMILQLYSFQQQGHTFPTPTQLAQIMSINEQKCMEVIRELLKKGLLEITEEIDDHNLRCEAYSLAPLWLKLINHNEKNDQQPIEAPTFPSIIEQAEESIYSVFEKEFGRLLSPFEIETLTMWMDQDDHNEKLIKTALKEAVISGKLNFRYIDRILFEWKKNGIKQVEQAINYSKHFRKKETREPQNETKYTGSIPFYNWLEK
ncbi:DnaD domain-containing protein [Bacillus sp. AFS017336]|uniref:DnaD domain-containing protein n=1 Tax=Bacillus sp. AFS017336 TaxID=2033489 RepID=UPI000BF03BE8|nr:DnaD domain-containing protein [Bacillus sp. AFS017336]PEL11701.1 DNA replication protein DnaD [Bacillus sp. AFS017336]